MTVTRFHLYWLIFTSFLWAGSEAGRQGFADAPAPGYDTDFLPFMDKMFSGLPAPTRLDLEQRGPNAGYRPYWYAYNFAVNYLDKQKDTAANASSHEDWDDGLGGGTGQGVWGGGKLSLVAASNDSLGAGALLDRDLQGSAEAGDKCFPNLGKTCRLGMPPWFYAADPDWIVSMQKRTADCDTCSEENKKVGTVCTVDKTGTVFQDTDLCIMEKMNCLGGMAYLRGDQWRYDRKWPTYPFLMKPQWARVAMRGTCDVDIRLYNKWPYTAAEYFVVVYGWPWSGPKSAIYPDIAEPYVNDYVWYRKDSSWGWAVNKNNFTEYTIVWNPKTGWFLLSQARNKDWDKEYNVEYVDPHPRDFKYLDIAAGWSGYDMEFILHDLPTDLTMLHSGRCVYVGPKDVFPSDTEEIHKYKEALEDAYQNRLKLLKAQSVRPQDWNAQDGDYVEY